MGRRKITIRQITDPKLRHITFNKRKNGLIKKAAELSMLCNVNMLLVFEDGAGNLVQFSKNKLSNFNNFFQECTYHNVVELTAKEYPHFFKVNHYKKTKGKLAEANGSGDGEQDDDDSDINSGDIYNFNPADLKDEASKGQSEQKSKELIVKKATQPQPQSSFNHYMIQPKSETLTQDNERVSLPNENRIISETNNGANKKQKAKSTFPQNPVQQLEAPSSKIQKIPTIDAASVKNPLNGNEMTEANFPSINPYRKDLYLEEQAKQLDGKGMEFNPNSYLPDPLKRLGSVPDAIPSPFQFYPQNNRLRPFNNFGLPFTNEEALNSMLKGYSHFTFPIPTNVNLMNKPPTNGEMDEKFLETAKMLNLLNQPQNRQNLFTFPTDYSKMSANDPMRQVANANQPDFHNQYFEENHDDQTGMYKTDPRFENAMPPANLNDRRYGGYGGYMNGYEEEYAGADKTKKFKHN